MQLACSTINVRSLSLMLFRTLWMLGMYPKSIRFVLQISKITRIDTSNTSAIDGIKSAKTKTQISIATKLQIESSLRLNQLNGFNTIISIWSKNVLNQSDSITFKTITSKLNSNHIRFPVWKIHHIYFVCLFRSNGNSGVQMTICYFHSFGRVLFIFLQFGFIWHAYKWIMKIIIIMMMIIMAINQRMCGGRPTCVQNVYLHFTTCLHQHNCLSENEWAHTQKQNNWDRKGGGERV